jgi:hypothetical protein
LAVLSLACAPRFGRFTVRIGDAVDWVHQRQPGPRGVGCHKRGLRLTAGIEIPRRR